MQQELIDLKREIRDLKTAQTVPSIMKFSMATFTIPQNLADGFYYWTIRYDDSENTTTPITFDDSFLFVLENYDPITNTQKIPFESVNGTYAGETLTILSTRPIASITFDS